MVSNSGPNQAAHFALVRALASGTAQIDPHETIDSAYIDGRFYAAKAPGLAMLTLPWYGTLRALGLQSAPPGEAGYRHRLWELGLFGSVLPMLLLVLLMYVAADRVLPGYGLPAAILVGAGTLLLPFATLFFDHVLSAALGFGAFFLLLGGRTRTRLLGAGLLAGLAVTVEFPLGIVAVVLGVYAAVGGDRIRRLLAYTAGFLAGLAPLVAYNTWAFGSPFTLSYTNALRAPLGTGAPVVGANEHGLYGVGVPDPRAALSLLVSEKGLLVVTPLAIAALFGLPLLWRAGRRAESVVCTAVPLVFLTYNAGYYLPYGGQSPGPRFLVPALPFLVLPLAFVLRARPLVVVGIGVVSVGVMAMATITGPLTGVEYSIDTWFDRVGDGSAVETVFGWLGVEPSWVAALPFAALLALALGAALVRLPFPAAWRRELPLLAGVVGAWLLIVLVAPDLQPADEAHETDEGAIAVLLVLATIAIALHVAARSSRIGLLVLAPLFVLQLPRLESRPRASLLVAVVVLAFAVGAWRRLHRATITATLSPLETPPPVVQPAAGDVPSSKGRG